MKLPWSNSELKQEIEELEQRVEELEEEKQRVENRFEAEKERRSKLSTEKQEAEKQLKKLRQKLETQEATDEDEGEPEQDTELSKTDLSFQEAVSGVQKLKSVGSEDEDLVSVYCPEELSGLDGLRSFRNSVQGKTVEKLEGLESFICFTDELFIDVILHTRPFFDSNWSIGGSFNAETLEEFFEEEKTWVIVSAGDTRIVKETGGEIESVENVKTRVDRKHSQGGFSQGRFERKREEQIDNHIEAVREELDVENPFLLGEKTLCERLEGDYLGGFDDNRDLLDELYRFRLVG